MTEFMQILIFGTSLAMAYFLGATSSRKSSSEIRLIDKWPTAYIQFDSDMSQEDALRFLELAREMVLDGPEKVTAENALKDDEQSRDAFWAQSLKTGLASFESRSKSSHNPRDPQ
ncbi:hypothetical protein N0743_27720 [Pseudomonas aeruginosa]|nr:hypothetical protein [Pseudomonas aeruginosa]MCT0411418.1 hypothetical protein [Pseudomonas aeruginosa]